jgi:translation initiation factor 3 subunit E
MLAQKLGMEPTAAERWIVNLIRNARLEAKIDSKTNQVIMTSQYPSVYVPLSLSFCVALSLYVLMCRGGSYAQVVEKTKALTFRSLVLANAATSASGQPSGRQHRDRGDREGRGDRGDRGDREGRGDYYNRNERASAAPAAAETVA